MSIFPIFFVFLFGLIVGSFLNVLIYRLHTGESVVTGRSKCPHCGKVLDWLDLIPILSFVFLRRRCRYCREKISWQYPLVELVTGLLFTAAYLVELNNFQFLADYQLILLVLRDWIAAAYLVAIFVYDWKWMIIPDSLVLPAFFAVAVLNWLAGRMTLNSLLLGIIVGFGFFAVQYFFSKGKWIGGGDLRLGALLGALLGWPLILVALFITYIIGAVAAVAMIVVKRATAKSLVPFGVFLAPAAIFTLFYGVFILNWYLNWFN